VQARDRYGSQASFVLKQFGAEAVAFRPWHLLSGERGRDAGLIIRFKDRIPPPLGTIRRPIRLLWISATQRLTAASGRSASKTNGEY
jgi:hypothetical protein